MLRAVATSDLKLTGLNLTFEATEGGMLADIEQTRSVTVDPRSYLIARFSCLTVLKLGVNVRAVNDIGKWNLLDGVGERIGMSELFSSATNLKGLSLASVDNTPRSLGQPKALRYSLPMDLRSLSKLTCLPKLRKLELAQMRIFGVGETTGLQALLTALSGSLQWFSISNMYFWRPTDLAALLDHAANLPHLQQIDLRLLRAKERHWLLARNRCITLKGRNNGVDADQCGGVVELTELADYLHTP